ncbi:MAG TPA: acyltransferase family protein, partial [Syntrophorhabdaceae bacterium]|nr:acyltransferase family protein [Syntrophorhabdaceae bacterium]
GMFYGNATNNWLIHNAALWFLPCYFVVEMAFHLVKKYVTRNPAFPAVVGLLALSGYLYSLTSLPLWPFGGDLALVMLIFFLCGHVLRNYLLAYNLRTWVIIILFCTGFLFSLINGHVSVYRRMYDNILLFYVSALCSTIAWVEISKRLAPLKPITYIGQNTLPIFVLQGFAMRIIFGILEKGVGIDVYAHTSLLDFVLFVMAEFAVLIPVIYVLNRFTPSIVGKYAPHSHAASQRSVVVTPP